MTESQEQRLKETIEAIEESKTIEEAASKLGIKVRAVYGRLERRDLIIIRAVKLKVVSK